MTNTSKAIMFLAIFGGFYAGLYNQIHNPADFVSPHTFDAMTTIYNIISYPFGLWSLVVNKPFIQDHLLGFHSTVPVAWMIVLSPLLFTFSGLKTYKKGGRKIGGILSEYENELTAERKKFGPQNMKERLLNKFGLLRLTSIEKMLFYRFSVLLPEEYQHALRKQLKKMNRNYRFHLNDEKTIAVTVFDSYKFFFFKNTKMLRFNKNNNGNSEYIMVSGMIKGQNNENIAVDLFVQNRIIKRIRYDAEYALDEIAGPFEIYDIRVSPSVIRG